MAKKQVQVISINPRIFINEVIKLAKQGATLEDRNPVFKTPTMRCILDIDSDVEVEENHNVRVLASSKKPVESEKSFTTELVIDSNRHYDKDELEQMSLKQVREVVEKYGIKGRDKTLMIEEYLEAVKKFEQPAVEQKPTVEE